MAHVNKILPIVMLLTSVSFLNASELKEKCESPKSIVGTPTNKKACSPKLFTLSPIASSMSPITVEFEGETVSDLKRAMSPVLAQQLDKTVNQENVVVIHIPRAIISSSKIAELKKEGKRPEGRCLKIADDNTLLELLNKGSMKYVIKS